MVIQLIIEKSIYISYLVTVCHYIEKHLKINRHSNISSTCHVHYIGNQGLRSMYTSKQHLYLDGQVWRMY